MENKVDYTKDRRQDDDIDLGGGGVSGKFLGGLIVVVVGSVLLMRQLGVDIPYWLTSWPMIPITIGLYIGARSGFRNWGFMVPVIIGLVFLADDIYPDAINPRLLWPIAIIFIGLIIMLGPTRRWRSRFRRPHRGFRGPLDSTSTSSEDLIDVAAVFGGVEKNIVSKNFKGGEAVAVFGGNSINLSQADIQGQATLECVQVFGGTKLIVPSNWKIKSEMVTIFGGIEDKRSINRDTTDDNKVLIIEGTTIFGGLEIKSF